LTDPGYASRTMAAFGAGIIREAWERNGSER